MHSVEKPGSPEEVLEHVGVKGMRWGVRKAPGTGQKRAPLTKTKAYKVASKATQANVQSHYARKKARKERAAARAARPAQKGVALTRSSREFRAQNPTGKLQAKAIRTARVEAYAREKAIRKEKDSVERARMQRDHMNNPGTAIALRTTRGEKLVNGILAGAIRTKGVTGDAASIATAFTLGDAVARRRIERKQRKGGFT